MRARTDLDAKENDGSKTNPAVQGVHVCMRIRCQVVTVEDRLQADSGDDEGEGLQHRVSYFQSQLPLTAKHSVDQQCWRTDTGNTSHKNQSPDPESSW